MPQDLKSLRRKHGHLGKLAARAAQLPGAAQLQAAGQLPRRLVIPHEGDRALVAGAEAVQGAMPLWQLEAARRQRQARGGRTRISVYNTCSSAMSRWRPRTCTQCRVARLV